MAPIALLTPSLEIVPGIVHSAVLPKSSSSLIKGVISCSCVGAWSQGGVINIFPVKPFETVMVIKGRTNKIN